MNWTIETFRAGVSLEVASDDHGVRGTWYRIQDGSQVIVTTRNRGDALRRFQRLVRLVSAAS